MIKETLGYFLRLLDGSIVPTKDWDESDRLAGRSEIQGDDVLGVIVLGPKKGREAVIVGLITGEQAKAAGVDAMVLLEERTAPN